MQLRPTLILCLTAACGRFGFEPPSSGADADGDGDADVVVEPAELVQALAPGFVRTGSVDIPITYDADHLLVVGVYWNVSTLTIDVTDTEGLSWQSLPQQAAPCADECGESVEALWYVRTPTAATSTVTVTQSSGVCPLGAFVLDYAGLSPTVLDVSGAIATMSSTVAVAPPLTVDRTAVVLAMYTDGRSMGVFTAGAGFTNLAVDPVWYSMISGAENVGPGTHSPSAALPAGHEDACWTATAAAFAVGP